MSKQSIKAVIIKKSTGNAFYKFGPLTNGEGKLNELYLPFSKKFTFDDLKYFAGMLDGDGHISLKNGRASVELELEEKDAFPVAFLADALDLSVQYSVRSGGKTIQNKDRKKTSSLRTFVQGEKAYMLLCMIFPFLLEKKGVVRKILATKFSNLDFFSLEKQFSFAYLAGYADAEGSFQKLIRTSKRTNHSNMSFRFQLTSTDEDHIRYLCSCLREKGFNVKVHSYKRNRLRKDGSPNKDMHRIDVTDLRSLKRLYNLFLPYAKIHRKIDVMKSTIIYVDYFSAKHYDKEKVGRLARRKDEYKKENSI